MLFVCSFARSKLFPLSFFPSSVLFCQVELQIPLPCLLLQRARAPRLKKKLNPISEVSPALIDHLRRAGRVGGLIDSREKTRLPGKSCQELEFCGECNQIAGQPYYCNAKQTQSMIALRRTTRLWISLAIFACLCLPDGVTSHVLVFLHYPSVRVSWSVGG